MWHNARLLDCYGPMTLFCWHLNPKAMRLNIVYLPKGLLWDLELILFTSQSKGHGIEHGVFA
jgi:hypothetical protein